ncbi:MAG: hypothetical protein IKE76_03870, partial [Clostridia bacterium]|nr:hypothetical protein [Clostridia bacterium]
MTLFILHTILCGTALFGLRDRLLVVSDFGHGRLSGSGRRFNGGSGRRGSLGDGRGLTGRVGLQGLALGGQ